MHKSMCLVRSRLVLVTNSSSRLFASLAADTATILPYSKDLADQRRKYGEGMMRKAEEHLSIQRQYEEENEAKLKEARERRQKEREAKQILEVCLLAFYSLAA